MRLPKKKNYQPFTCSDDLVELWKNRNSRSGSRDFNRKRRAFSFNRKLAWEDWDDIHFEWEED